ncbi:MAG: acyl--CoA ligase [Alphaproteobacteria bacterium]|nr:acyl--CoA ligase [Alphaproteobacteria bacterium]MBV9900103.1 acyl--CoA ligase [Alphaproteobacteria bacterium]
MALRAFAGWMNDAAAAAASRNGVTIGEAFVSWRDIDRKAAAQARDLRPFATYVVDPDAGHDSFVALLAVARTPAAALLWGVPAELPLPSEKIAPGLHVAEPNPLLRRLGDRPLYGSLTSGSSGTAKLPIGFADQMTLTGFHYDKMLYEPTLGEPGEGGTLATGLPPAYSATLMMAIIPAWHTARNLLVVRPDRWDLIHAQAAKAKVMAMSVPALLPLACASAPKGSRGAGLTLLTTAGYLTRSRIAAVRERLDEAGLMSSYGASETGVMTLDPAPTGELHVGRPLFGKPVWLSGAGDDSVGKVTTSGPDCREYYLDGAPIRHMDGTVAMTDLGHFDGSGQLYLDGRLDAGEKMRGVTIYPRRIERHLLGMRDLEDAKVQVLPGAGLAPDRLVATIVGNVSEEAVRAYCEPLPDFLRPTHYVIKAAELAYSNRGKL